MPEPTDQDLLCLLDEGIRLCQAWEEASSDQFAALSRGDLASLVAFSARQSILLERFAFLQNEWRRMQRLGLIQNLPDEGAGNASDPSQRAQVVARRHELLAVAERVFAANYRNAKALNLLNALGAKCEPLIGLDAGRCYDRRGAASHRLTAVRTTIDREG